MKRLEDFTVEDLKQLRQEIVLDSIYIGDYKNSFGISPYYVYLFFDSYLDFIEGLGNEDSAITSEPAELRWSKTLERYDNIDTLKEWYDVYDTFDWVEYEDNEAIESDEN